MVPFRNTTTATRQRQSGHATNSNPQQRQPRYIIATCSTALHRAALAVRQFLRRKLSSGDSRHHCSAAVSRACSFASHRSQPHCGSDLHPTTWELAFLLLISIDTGLAGATGMAQRQRAVCTRGSSPQQDDLSAPHARGIRQQPLYRGNSCIITMCLLFAEVIFSPAAQQYPAAAHRLAAAHLLAVQR